MKKSGICRVGAGGEFGRVVSAVVIGIGIVRRVAGAVGGAEILEPPDRQRVRGGQGHGRIAIRAGFEQDQP